MESEIITVEKLDEDQVIIGQGNFSIYTCDDIFRTLLTTAPEIKIGVAMNEAVPKLVRYTDNDEDLGKKAANTALKIGAGHLFVIFMRNAYPINVLSTLKAIPGVVNIYIATANPIEVIIGKTKLGNSILGVVDGQTANNIETNEQREERRSLVKKIGYILG
ncbi:MAG: adenosine monophosphate-protein transferase [Candidatus Lokiarchaeota archaeon]|nr:adenosine monophosphate-protein transferase [Candidatus Lokiarchaeota archaeon]